MTARWRSQVFKVLRCREKSDRTHRPVGRRDRGCVEAADPVSEHEIAEDRGKQRHQHGAKEAGRDRHGEAGLCERKTTFQTERHQQVERQESGDGCRNFEIGSDQTGEHTEDKEQDGGIEQCGHGV